MNYQVNLEKLEEILLTHCDNPRALPTYLSDLVRVGEPIDCNKFTNELVDVVFNNLTFVFLIMTVLTCENSAEVIKAIFAHIKRGVSAHSGSGKFIFFFCGSDSKGYGSFSKSAYANFKIWNWKYD